MAEVLERIAAQSGGESLESWAERELAVDRESHRRWMSGVVGASGAFRLGRDTGVQTAIGDAPATGANGDGRGDGDDGAAATQRAAAITATTPMTGMVARSRRTR